MKFIIRNDDVAADTTLIEIERFCEICDKYGFQIIQAITPIGEVRKVKSAKMTNEQIKSLEPKLFGENKEVVEYLKSRHDLIAVHGLWHSHIPSTDDIKKAKDILSDIGFSPTYFVPPFNEGDYPSVVEGLTTSILSASQGQRLEDFLASGTPNAPIMYLHSWRFNNEPQLLRNYKWYTFDQLETCLKRLQ